MTMHDQMRDLLAAYTAGSATRAERQLVGAHLAACATCREELASWQVIRAAVRAASPRVAAPGPQLVAAVLARAGVSAVRGPTGAELTLATSPGHRLRHAAAVLSGSCRWSAVGCGWLRLWSWRWVRRFGPQGGW